VKKYSKLYAITLDGAILTYPVLEEFMDRNKTKIRSADLWFRLHGSGNKRVFFSVKTAAAEVNGYPDWLRHAVKVVEFLPCRTIGE